MKKNNVAVTDQVRWITQVGVQWDQVREVLLQKHHGILQNNASIAIYVGNAPKMVARKAWNLGDILIRSEFIRTPDTNWLSEYPRTKRHVPLW